MKNKTIFTMLPVLLTLFSFLLVSIPASGQVSPQADVYISNANRSITINSYGVVVVNDTFTLVNNGSSSTNYAIIALRSNYSDYLYYISAFGENNETLTISSEYSLNVNNSGWVISLPDISPSENYTLTVIMVFGGIIQPNTSGKYYLDFYAYPTSPYNISVLNASISVPGSLTYPTDSTYSAENISSYNFTWMKIEYSYVGHLIKYPYFERSLQIDAWGSIKVKEVHEINVINIGSLEVSTLSFTLLPSAYDIKVYDSAGYLTFVSNEEEDGVTYSELVVSLRISLDAGDNYTLYVEYMIDPNVLRDETGALQIPLTLPDWIVNLFKMEVILPSGSTFTTTSTGGEISEVDGNVILSYVLENVTTFHEAEYTVNYQINMLAALARPLIISGVIGLICIVYAVYQLTRKEEVFIPREEEKKAPPPLIKEFARLYDEKVALRIQIEKLKQDARKGKIKRRDYRKRYETFTKNIEKIDKEIQKIRDELLQYGGRLAKIIRDLEITEAQIDHKKSSLAEFASRYRLGKISRDAYLKVRKDLEGEINKAEHKINKLLLTLKEEIS
ncbi:MAG: hypothetical protein ACTSPL_02475 [Candidatus Odinarchaeia archaeon]